MVQGWSIIQNKRMKVINYFRVKKIVLISFKLVLLFFSPSPIFPAMAVDAIIENDGVLEGFHALTQEQKNDVNS